MPTTTWKNLERRIARGLNTRRTPLSGSASTLTHSDTLSTRFYVECKWRRRLALDRLFTGIKALARKEKKTPILVQHQANSPLTLVTLEWGTFLGLARDAQEWRNHHHDPNSQHQSATPL